MLAESRAGGCSGAPNPHIARLTVTCIDTHSPGPTLQAVQVSVRDVATNVHRAPPVLLLCDGVVIWQILPPLPGLPSGAESEGKMSSLRVLHVNWVTLGADKFVEHGVFVLIPNKISNFPNVDLNHRVESLLIFLESNYNFGLVLVTLWKELGQDAEFEARS